MDFSPLDPTRDAERWQRMLRSVSERVILRRAAPRTIPFQLVQWARPALAIAAGLTIIVWVGALLGKPVLLPQADLNQALSQWQANSDVFAAEQLMQALGDAYGDR